MIFLVLINSIYGRETTSQAVNTLRFTHNKKKTLNCRNVVATRGIPLTILY